MRANKGVLAYLVLTFGISWTLWEAAFRLGLGPESPFFQLAILPGAFAPAVAALIVRAWVTRRGFRRRRLAPESAPRLGLLSAGLDLPAGGSGDDQRPGSRAGAGSSRTSPLGGPPMPGWGEAAKPAAPYLLWLLPPQLLLTALLATPLLWGEEFGWRGYLQLRLYPGRPLLAALATGVIWGLWHLPVNLRGYNFPGQPVLGMLVFTVSTILLSIFFGWLRQRTGSIWAPSLAHAATNAVGGSLMLLLFLGGGKPLYVAYLGILGWVPLGALAGWIAWRGYPKGSEQSLAG